MKNTTKESIRKLLLSLTKEELLNTDALEKCLEAIENTANCEKVVSCLPVDKQCRLITCLDDVCKITDVLPKYSMIVVLPMIAEPSWSCMRYRYPCEIYEFIDDNHNEFIYTKEDVGVQHSKSIEVVASDRPTAITDVRKKHGCVDNYHQLTLESKHYRYATWNGGFPHIYAFRLDKLWTSSGVEWRAFIERCPSLNKQCDDTYNTHRVWSVSEGNYYIDFCPAIRRLSDIKAVVRAWSRMMDNYIATGTVKFIV